MNDQRLYERIISAFAVMNAEAEQMGVVCVCVDKEMKLFAIERSLPAELQITALVNFAFVPVACGF